MSDAPERIWIDRGPNGGWMKRFERMPDSEHEYIRADIAAARIAALEAERDEALRRRDAWRAKAEGYDAVRLALREKVGAPWPQSLSRLMWAGIAADEKRRADDAEAEVATAYARGLEDAAKVAGYQSECWGHEGYVAAAVAAAIRAMKAPSI
jgi:hypothetical protein